MNNSHFWEHLRWWSWSTWTQLQPGILISFHCSPFSRQVGFLLLTNPVELNCSILRGNHPKSQSCPLKGHTFFDNITTSSKTPTSWHARRGQGVRQASTPNLRRRRQRRQLPKLWRWIGERCWASPYFSTVLSTPWGKNGFYAWTRES